MRVSRWLLGLSTSLSAVIALSAGCGSSSSSTSPQDSGLGMDVTMEAAPMEAAAEAEPETGPMDAGSDGACVPDANISMLPIPDASLGDSGATAAGCVACFNTMSACAPIITDCNASCTCVADFQKFETCLAQPMATLMNCALTNLATALPSSDLTALLGCGTACAVTCGYTLPVDSGMGDTGTGDSSSGDSAAD